MLSSLLQDVRIGARQLARNPGFTLIAVLSLGIGIGANTATFSFADGLLLRPLPVPHASEVVTVGSMSPATGGTDLLRVSYPDYVDVREASSFAGGLVATEDMAVQFAANPGETAAIRTVTLASGNFFAVMGVQPALGRVFGPTEDAVPNRDAVVVLSHRFWQRVLAGDPAVVGRHVRMNGIDFTVVGVASESFTGLDLFVRPDFYVPLMMWPSLVGTDQASPLEQRDRRELDLKGRLANGVSLDQAGADVARVGATLAAEYPATNRGYEIRVRTEMQNRLADFDSLVPAIGMLSLLGVVIVVVACVNVAGLLTSRAPARAREIAVRLSIGAGRRRIVRQLLTESALLAFGGALAGAVVGYLGVLLWRQIPIEADLAIELLFEMDGRALLVNSVVAVASVFVFGLAPALRGSRASLTDVLRAAGGGGGGGRIGWGRGALVAVQVALSLVFISVTAFMYTSFSKTVAVGPGVRTDGVLIMNFNNQLARYGPERAQQFLEQLADRARGVAGVDAVSLASFIPMSGLNSDRTPIAPEGYEFPAGFDSESVITSYVDADFFGLMDIPVTAGRVFSTGDTAGAPRVAIINQTLADKFWPGESPLGRRFRANGAEGPWVEVVGVVPRGRYFSVTDPPLSFMYLPYAQAAQTRMALVTRSSTDPLALVETLRSIVRELDPDLAVAAVRTLDSLYYDHSIRSFMVFIYAIAAMGVMSVTLSFAGIYGLVASNVAQRTREIGLRMAVGADRRRVIRMVMGQAFRVTLVGLGVGLLLTFGADQAMRAAFPGGNGDAGRELIDYVRVIAVMLLVTGLAAYLPARRAVRIEPTQALRYE